MPDNLRTRIAAVLDQHKTDPHDEWTCQCNSTGIRWADHVADAVIRELCIHREDMNEWAVLANGFRGHRYVTHWEENDPAPVTKIRSAEKLGLTGDGK